MGDHLQQPDEERSEFSDSGKRKLEDTIELAKQKAQEIASRLISDAADPKRQRLGSENPSEPSPWSNSAPPAPSYPVSYAREQSQYGVQSSKKITIPNGKVGVVIGKGGETIKYIQLQSGAKIQITKDQEADPHALTRDVDLTGTPDQISRAEQLITDAISEADAGAYSNSSQGSNTKQSGAEQYSTKVPNDKVGLLIGKGGETIKYMQNKSGAKMQVSLKTINDIRTNLNLRCGPKCSTVSSSEYQSSKKYLQLCREIIPLHLPAGDPTTERTIYINGTAEQIEAAKELVNEVVNGKRILTSGGTNTYQQQAYQQPPYWAAGGQPPMQQQQAQYGYQQPGTHPTPPAYYGNYAAQPPAWDQSNQSAPQPPHQSTGYGYYGQQPQMGAAQVNPNYGYGQAPGAAANNYSQGYGQQPSSYGQVQAAPTHDQQKPYPTSGYGQSTDGAVASSQPSQEAPAYPQAAYNHPYWNSAGYPGQPAAAQTGYDQTGYSQAAYGTATQQDYGQGGYAAQPPAAGDYGQGAYSSGGYGQQQAETTPQTGTAANGATESGGYEVTTNNENGGQSGDGSSNDVKKEAPHSES
ncbi:unnamed protein product [Linum tenue]|uniref:K Homology domain-containing protein n=2 Tax=Linum tenue TaxID=586396 RepID=A0AAV0JDD5_9ROSI|nr:unnamed protein product [Linum tenue]